MHLGIMLPSDGSEGETSMETKSNTANASGMQQLIPAIVFSLVIGGIGGYFVRYYSPGSNVQVIDTHFGMGNAGGGPGAGPPAGGTGAPGSGGMGGMRGGMGGMGGGMGEPPAGMALSRLVRNLVTIEQVQHRGLSPQQAQTLLPILEQIQSADKLPDADAKARLDAINKALTDEQKQALDLLQPQRGGRGGGGGGGMGGGMGGGRPDPERPFASERSKKSLTDLIADLQTVGKK
jgi:hypothetical protein